MDKFVDNLDVLMFREEDKFVYFLDLNLFKEDFLNDVIEGLFKD